jgi:hypothetical protein
VQKRYEAVGNGWPKLSRIQLASQCVKWERILSEEIQFKNSFWIGEVKLF